MLNRNKVILYLSYFTISVIMTVLYLIKNLADKKNDKVKFKVVPKTDEEYISNKYGSIGFFDSYRYLSSSLHKLVKTVFDNNHKTLKNLKGENVGKH